MTVSKGTHNDGKHAHSDTHTRINTHGTGRTEKPFRKPGIRIIRNGDASTFKGKVSYSVLLMALYSHSGLPRCKQISCVTSPYKQRHGSQTKTSPDYLENSLLKNVWLRPLTMWNGISMTQMSVARGHVLIASVPYNYFTPPSARPTVQSTKQWYVGPLWSKAFFDVRMNVSIPNYPRRSVAHACWRSPCQRSAVNSLRRFWGCSSSPGALKMKLHVQILRRNSIFRRQ